MIRAAFFSLSLLMFGQVMFAGSLFAQQVCQRGSAGIYPCSGINLHVFLPKADIGGGNMNDVWGWTDPLSGREYALVGRTSGTSFVDITQSLNPTFIGSLSTETSSSGWRDIKVYKNYAFIVADNAGPHGMQVFDLTRLRDIAEVPEVFTADAVYDGIGSAHNVVINEDSGFAYIVGSSDCAGGLHMVDIRAPLDPSFVGCFSEDGYTHDAQCVTYAGPDPDYAGREICFAANTDTVTIVDVTDKGFPVQVFRAGYPGSGYVHQGWLTGDHKYFLQNDELDELNNSTNTTTYIWDVTDLDSPEILTTYEGASRSIDHNLYTKGNFVFQSNYTSGLRILDIRDISNPVEIGYFDTYPDTNSPSFSGNWSNYPYFASGNIPVTGIGEGLFILKPTLQLLPAALVGFSAEVIEEGVMVSWQTQREDGIASFDVQLQRPGGSFESLATVAGSGTSTIDQAYSTLIGGVGAGPQVIRLSILTEGSDEYYSDTITLFVPVEGTHLLFPAFPNPLSATSRIALIVGEEQHVVVSVYDASGRQKAVLHDGLIAADSRHTFSIDASRLAGGTYFVRAVGENFDATTSVTVLK